jgi:histidine phosphotransferase ChpT
MAFGAAGSAGAEIDLGDAESVARGFIEDERITLGWQLPRVLMAKNRVKLLLNLVMLAGQIIPRGGTITVETADEAEQAGFKLTVSGVNPRIPQKMPLLASGQSEGSVDAHAIQPFYAGLLARTCGLAITIEQDGEQVVVAAR